MEAAVPLQHIEMLCSMKFKQDDSNNLDQIYTNWEEMWDLDLLGSADYSREGCGQVPDAQG